MRRSAASPTASHALAPTPASALAACPADLMRLLGYVYLQHGQPSRAMVMFDALHALDPGDPLAARSLALARLRCGQPDAALATLHELLDQGDNHAATHVLRAQALLATGQVTASALAMRAYVAARAVPAPLTAPDGR